MPKALNLTDMLWRNDAANADRAQEAGKASKAASKRAKAEFIPDQPAPQGSAKSFQERVKESQARMAKKDHTFFKRSENRGAHTENRSAQPEASPAPERSTAEARPVESRAPEAKPAEAAAAPERAARPAARKEASKIREAEAKEAPSASSASSASSAGTVECARPQGLEAAGEEGFVSIEEAGLDIDTLQARLEELGIEATPEQLRDPAFLAEMLWMIDALPLATPVVPDAAVATAVVAPTDLLEGAPAEGEAVAADASGASPVQAQQASPAAEAPAALLAANAGPAAALPQASEAEAAAIPAESFDWTSVEEGEREEIAALIREKLGALADKAPAGPETPVARAGTADLPASVQLARAGAVTPLEIEAPEADLTLADPDRLRVLQSAAFAGPAADDRLALSTDPDFALEADAEDADTADLPSLNVPDASAEGNEDREGASDAFGREATQSRAAEAFAGREQASAREASAPTFQSSLDQVRAAETRMAQARQAALPHPQMAHEQNVLAQIARKLSGLGVRGNEEIRIQLEPEHLGKVRIAIEMRGEGLTARIAVESESVRQMVDANLAALKDSLEGQGVKIQGMEVSVEQRHSALFNPDGSNAREFFRQRGDGLSAAGEGADSREDAAETDTGRRMGYNTMEYIA